MSAATIIKRAQFDGVEIALSPVGSLKLSGEAANVSKWIPFLTSHKDEILGALEALAVARSAHKHHKETCPVCSTGWAATEGCATHGELWQAYQAALADVHGADKVYGQGDDENGTALTRSRFVPAPEPQNGYRTVITAQVRPPAWHEARDALHGHLMTCPKCKPTGRCDDGRQLEHLYSEQCAIPSD